MLARMSSLRRARLTASGDFLPWRVDFPEDPWAHVLPPIPHIMHIIFPWGDSRTHPAVRVLPAASCTIPVPKRRRRPCCPDGHRLSRSRRCSTLRCVSRAWNQRISWPTCHPRFSRPRSGGWGTTFVPLHSGRDALLWWWGPLNATRNVPNGDVAA